MFWYRVFNRKISLKQRGRQVVNYCLEQSVANQLNIAHVVEYPKCGGSWIRNMIRIYRETDLYTYNRIIRKNDVVMSHSLYQHRYGKPIVVVRDPRDVFVSFYHFENLYEKSDQNSVLFKYYQHDPERPLKEDFARYLRAKLMHVSHPWFFYSQFLDSWLNRPNTCVVRYEDCLKEPETQLVRMLRFLNDHVELDRISQTVEKTSFKAITKEKYGKSRDSGDEDNTKFHRKGISGDWKNHFNEEACQLLEKFEGTSLRRLGYEQDNTWVDKYVGKTVETYEEKNKVYSV